MTCAFCGIKFEHIMDLQNQEYKQAICYNQNCDKYAIPQIIKIEKEDKE